MTRDHALAELEACRSEVRAHRVQALYLFGSTARDAATETSDIDLFLDVDPVTRFNAFDLVEIKALLERRLGIPVDVTTRDGLHPRLRDKIEQEAIRVF
jgi:predicted nucleotidyltransferase